MANSSTFAQENIGILETVSGELADALVERGWASEEMLRKLCWSASKCIYDKTLNELAVDKLAELVDVFYNYSNFEEGEEHAFDMGACWAIVVSIRNAISIVSERASNEVLERLVSTHAKLFATLAEKPGINQGELARILGKKPARQSQIMSELREHNLVSSIRCGKEKNYYLTNKAKQILNTREAEDSQLPTSPMLDARLSQREGNDAASIGKYIAVACETSLETMRRNSSNFDVRASHSVMDNDFDIPVQSIGKKIISLKNCDDNNLNNARGFDQYFFQPIAQRI